MDLQEKVWNDEEHFFARLRGSGWTVLYSFPISLLSRGGSLAALMNKHIRVSRSTGGWMVEADELRAVARDTLSDLRDAVEQYFEIHPVTDS